MKARTQKNTPKKQLENTETPMPEEEAPLSESEPVFYVQEPDNFECKRVHH